MVRDSNINSITAVVHNVSCTTTGNTSVVSVSLNKCTCSVTRRRTLTHTCGSTIVMTTTKGSGHYVCPRGYPIGGMMNTPVCPTTFAFILNIRTSSGHNGLTAFDGCSRSNPLFFGPRCFSRRRVCGCRLHTPNINVCDACPGKRCGALDNASVTYPLITKTVSHLLRYGRCTGGRILFNSLVRAHSNSVGVFRTCGVASTSHGPALSFIACRLRSAVGNSNSRHPSGDRAVRVCPALHGT